MSYFIETSFGSLNKTGEYLCGDKVETAENGKDTFLVIADGLGSGVKANILASLTSKIIITMLSQGADISDIIETMASTLPVCREQKAAYSTFSFLHVGSNGHARIVEFDTPETIVLIRGKSAPLTRNTFTIHDKKISETYINLKSGDYCILISDGVVHAGAGSLLNLGWQHKNVVAFLEKSYSPDSTPRAIRSHLLKACNNLYAGSPGDDTTVAVCKIRLPNIASIMVGSPLNQEDDRKVFDLMMQGDTKIVCGRTAAQIVSRLAKKKLRTELDYMTQNVPPVGYIDGIDLVTEGTVTLGKALEIMLQYEKDAVLTGGNNGAELLAQALIANCTSAKFFVGQALNTHMPTEPNIKIKLVNEIEACLLRLNKHVDIEYF